MSKLATVTGTQAKETIYVDIDDEITGLIDKVTSSKAKVVALVLPKRASVMQSIVNMKLLKHASETAGKNVVLITSEPSLMPLAGLVGVHVAETPTSKPSIPAAPKSVDDTPEEISENFAVTDASETASDDFDPAAAAATPIGALAKEPDSILMADAPDETDVINTSDTDEAITPVKRNKKLVVPNFNKFRLALLLGLLGLALLIAGGVYAFIVMPKAAVAITTNSSTINSNLNLVLDTNATTLDKDKRIMPAVAQTTKKEVTQEAPATGQQNNGEKASGSVKLTTKVCAPNLGTTPDNYPAGSAVATNGNTYITQQSGKYTMASLSGSCATYSTQSIDIVAVKSGSAANTGASATFTTNDGSTGSGSAGGGTDKVDKVLSQSDIDAAKAKISEQDATAIKNELNTQLKAKGMIPVASTFLTGEQEVKTSANVGDKVDSVKVTASVPYTMLGIKADDLRTLVLAEVTTKIDVKKQKISDDGVAKATFSQDVAGSATGANVTARVKSVAGPEFDIPAIKKQIAGMKEGDVKEVLKQIPGVEEVQVAYSPFWVTKIPNKPEKVTIMIDGAIK